MKTYHIYSENVFYCVCSADTASEAIKKAIKEIISNDHKNKTFRAIPFMPLTTKKN